MQKLDPKSDNKNLYKDIVQLDNFSDKFHQQLWKRIKQCVELSRDNPSVIISTLKICEYGDQFIEQGEIKIKCFKSDAETDYYQKKCFEIISESVNQKFNEQFKESQNISEVIESAKFVVNDLINILDFTVKCFPKKYQIFDFFQQEYKKNIEAKILPYLDDEEHIKEQYGTLITLLNWLDKYESVLQRAGIENSYQINIRNKVKLFMPYFLDHIEAMLDDYCQKVILKDKIDHQSLESIKNKIESQQELISLFPEDIFKFLNQQIELLAPKLSGELYPEFMRQIGNTINNIQMQECERIIQIAENSLKEEEDSQQVSSMYLIILFINNYYKCSLFSVETREYCQKFSKSLNIQERIDKIFKIELNQAFSTSLQSFFDIILKYVFKEIHSQIIPLLFTPPWLRDDLVETSLLTLDAYFQELKNSLINPIHYNRLVKQSLDNFINLYFNQLIVSIQSCFNQCQDFKSKFNLITTKNKTDLLTIFSDRNTVKEQTDKDLKVINQKLQPYQDMIGKKFYDKTISKFNILLNLLQNNKNELESQYFACYENFENLGKYILEAVLCIRSDTDSKFKLQQLQKYDVIIEKYVK